MILEFTEITSEDYRIEATAVSQIVFVNQKYLIPHLTPVFRDYNIHLEFSTCPNKFKWLLSTENLVLNAVFKDF